MPGRLELGMLPCETALDPGFISVVLVCEIDNVIVVDEREAKRLLLTSTASEVVPAVGSAPGTPIERSPVAV